MSRPTIEYGGGASAARTVQAWAIAALLCNLAIAPLLALAYLHHERTVVVEQLRHDIEHACEPEPTERPLTLDEV